MSKAQEHDLNILLFEDNQADANIVTEYLKDSELTHQLTIARRLSDGARILKKQSFDLIILELSLPDSKGINTLEAVRELSDNEVIIVLTAAKNEKFSLQALKTGAQDYLIKNTLSSEVLRRAIRYAIERTKLIKEIEASAVEMKHREILLRRIFDANTDAMLILTPEYEIKFLNPAAGQLLEADIDSLIGETFPFELESGKTTELEIPGPKDTTRLMALSAVDLIWEGASARLATLRDITLHRKTERDLKREKERLSVTLDSIADAVIAVDKHGNLERINPEATRMTGITNDVAIGQPLANILRFKDPTTGKVIIDPSQVLLSRTPTIIHPELGIQLLRRNEDPLLVNAEMRPILDEDKGHYGWVVVLRDMTSLKRAEEELYKSEKLQSISLLAGGIAHDFNNILSAILGNISVVRVDIADDHKHASKLLAAEKAALQATSLTQQLLTFSKGGTPLFESTTITQLVKDCAQFILRGSNVRCEIQQPDEIWAVDVDKGQIAQVLNNLLINADQAMPEGGVIDINIRNTKIDTNEIQGLKQGNYLSIKVTDQGIGIVPENLTRIFDPYFTTKENGNGLGLASSYSIIKNHKGIIIVESVIDSGSTFTIYLPKSNVESTPPLEDPSHDDSKKNHSIQAGHGRILVMDDMEAMMMVAGEIISMLGYEVEYATNGHEAIDIYKTANENGNPFDAVVFDLTVPGGMGGEEAAEILVKYDPKLLAIASSGYTTTNVMSDYENSPFSAVVPKPYRIKEMSDALSTVLSKKSPRK
ncbi:MAG TPA: hypothetical protein DCX06_12365 [Opitutae bacterium]|nr:hypothetical protein [Opitutae bacterium]